MHHKTLEQGDQPNYDQNLTFIAAPILPKTKQIQIQSTTNPKSVQNQNQDDEIDNQQQIGASKIFNVAFGLSDVSKQYEMLDFHEDARYGELEAVAFKMLSDGSTSAQSIETEACADNFLEESFYQADKHTQEQISMNI